MDANDPRLTELANLITADTLAELERHYPGSPCNAKDAEARIKPGAKYAKIDRGTSGKYMVDQDGNIFGIKGYGVVHKGHWYGTLDTIHDYFWGSYVAVKKSERKVIRLAAHDGKPAGYIISEVRR